eukprot:gene41725-55342_t
MGIAKVDIDGSTVGMLNGWYPGKDWDKTKNLSTDGEA